ncbi:hypothetical protein KAR28_05200 [Candidatus Parcubacteria bacterium]|nr:hypothetical protein [Candidatus Parcubacteria bacterium]
MALRPEESGKLNDGEIKEIDEVEKKIDEKIRSSSLTDGKIEKCIMGGGYLTSLQELELKKRYQNSGWIDISFYSKSRDTVIGTTCDDLYFSMKKAPVHQKT